MNATPLSAALHSLAETRAVEAEAVQARLRAENALLAIVGELPSEGTRRFEDGELVAVVTASITRKVDSDKLTAIAPQIPEAIGKRLIRWKPELVTTELRYLQANEPELYGIVAQAIEAKPAKPSIRVEAVKQAEAA